MRTKGFQAYLEQRLDKDEIASIEQQAIKEVKSLRFARMITNAGSCFRTRSRTYLVRVETRCRAI